MDGRRDEVSASMSNGPRLSELPKVLCKQVGRGEAGEFKPVIDALFNLTSMVNQYRERLRRSMLMESVAFVIVDEQIVLEVVKIEDTWTALHFPLRCCVFIPIYPQILPRTDCFVF